MKNLVLFSLIFLFSLHSNTSSASIELFSAINKRLSLMEDVALFKAHKHLPIEDIEREKIVIEKAKESAKSNGISPKSIEEFFKTQIAVAKAIQYRYRADLLSQPTSRKAKDLQKEIRPQLLLLGDQIIREVAAHIKTEGAFKASQYFDFKKAIKVKYIEDPEKQRLFDTLLKIRFSPETKEKS